MKKRKLLWLIPLVLVLGTLSFCTIHSEMNERKIEAFEKNAITQFPTIREELEACVEIVIPAFLEIDAYNVGKYNHDERKRTPYTPEIYEIYRDEYSPELQEALETIWGLGVISMYLSEQVGELSFELEQDILEFHFFFYYYIYDRNAPYTSASGRDDSYSTILADNWYFYSKPIGYFY